jgi:aryl carrier-like protein
VGVARGYLRRPGQTADRFVPNPHGPASERLYRTGDIARYQPDGAIEFLGRADTQVKLRGFRIELGEIEAALQASPEVRAGVVTLERGDGSTVHLVAYVVAASGRSSDVLEQSLRAHLAQTLPDYMVPAVFVFLDALPLTASGKTDRRQLSRPERPLDPSLFASPSNDIEAALVETWQDVLGAARVSLDDNFFDLGGDSILSIQAVSKAWTRGIKLTVRQLFEHPTVRRLAAVAERDDVEDVAPELEPDASVPLTPIQRQFFEDRREQPDYYNQAVLLETPPCDLAVVERAIAAIIRRHDALRARFVLGADGWTQRVSAAEASLVVGEFDLSRVPEPDLQREIARCGEQLQASLRLATGPLLRVALMRLGGTETRLACVIHHLAIDAVSWRVLLAELETHFAVRGPVSDRLQRNPPSFAHWARALDEYAHGEAIAAEQAYWIQRCRWDVGTLAVASDAPNVVGAARSISVSLSPSDTERLVWDLPRLYRAAVEEMLLTSVAVAFGEVLGFERVRLDVEGHGREHIVAGLDPSLIVGWLTTVFPVVLQVEHRSLAVSLARVKEQMRGVPQRGIGYGLLCQMSGRDDAEALRTAPPSGISFNYLGQIAAGEQSAFRLARESLGPTQPPGERRRPGETERVTDDGARRGIPGPRRHLSDLASAARPDLSQPVLAGVRDLCPAARNAPQRPRSRGLPSGVGDGHRLSRHPADGIRPWHHVGAAAGGTTRVDGAVERRGSSWLER